jgi:hypothetical protein
MHIKSTTKKIIKGMGNKGDDCGEYMHKKKSSSKENCIPRKGNKEPSLRNGSVKLSKPPD